MPIIYECGVCSGEFSITVDDESYEVNYCPHCGDQAEIELDLDSPRLSLESGFYKD